MRCIGKAERALELMLARVTDPSKRTFGKSLSEHGTIVADIANSRIEIDQSRFLVLSAARKIDEAGAKGAKKEISMAKVCNNNDNVIGIIQRGRKKKAFGMDNPER